MRFFETILSGAALVAAALALTIDEYPTTGVQAGRTYTITYSPKDDTPTTFILRQGESTNLDTIQTITTTATGGEFKWTVPETLPNKADYALEIRQGETVNYSGQFPLSGGSAAVSSARASASSAAASAASASAALSSMVSSAMASVTPSASANGTTVSSVALTRTSTRTSTSPTGSAPSVPEQSTAAGASLASSPYAAMLAVAGLAYFA